ncbi:ABC transporter ATP-binding protein [Micromonospora sp. DR5-3]|uniref:ABC transporter ATP-binding protein n=1 Tax=unclassified Micromonospora TaxID=2617518 RepID=UPI0011D8C488|nr:MULTISPECIES: ABC transporter ATP-binding protein [unclassified Micromonospora]MCW3817732.1 ABC transporter ATP-binding protein [Micromonospora sp. DR5-3]TYC20040.1 ABC transporter ATP-binding protein [Micromonospora sp. MP36]
MTTVSVEGLRVSYGKRVVLDGLDLELGPGVHGLLGPNGAGKTTLTRVLATVLRPDRGDVRLLGHRIDDHSGLRQARRRLGYLPQTFGFYPRFTVREFVEYFAWLKEMPPARIPLAVDRAIERVGLLDRADDRMKQLSGGMLRRAGIAQAIVNDPRLLLLDEPTAGLDPEQRVQFRALLREVGLDVVVLVSTHLVEDVVAACTRVSVVDGGRLVFTGLPDELIGTGGDSDSGDSPIERGYTAVLRGARTAPR